jgi:hypothetical protein
MYACVCAYGIYWTLIASFVIIVQLRLHQQNGSYAADYFGDVMGFLGFKVPAEKSFLP